MSQNPKATMATSPAPVTTMASEVRSSRLYQNERLSHTPVSWWLNRRYYPTPYDWRRIGEYVAAALAVFAVCEALTASADNMFVSYAFNIVLFALYAAYLVRRERIDLGAMLRAFLHR